jgi:hypothetical protein
VLDTCTCTHNYCGMNGIYYTILVHLYLYTDESGLGNISADPIIVAFENYKLQSKQTALLYWK